MTIGVVWLERELNQIWCACDSRISDSEKKKDTDIAPKISQIRIRLADANTTPREQTLNPVDAGYAGIIYAGNALVGLQTIAYATSCMQNLAVKRGLHAPDLRNLANLFGDILATQVSELAVKIESRALTEAVLFGYCRGQNKFRAFLLSPKLQSSTFEIIPHEIDLYLDHPPIVIGERQAITADLFRNAGPMGAVIQLIKDSNHPTIGGSLQSAHGDQSNLYHHFLLELDNSDTEFAAKKMLGIEVSQFELVGGAAIGLTGVSTGEFAPGHELKTKY